MATVIVCPNCQTRYETAALIPPEGRKVRCSKCGHVWQAVAVIEAVRPPVAPAAPMPRAPGAHAPRAPSAPAMAPRPQPMRAPVPPAGPRPESQPARGAPAMGGFGGIEGRPPNGSGQTIAPPFSAGAGADAAFDVADEFQADVPGSDSGSMSPMGGQEWSQDLGGYNAGALVPDDLNQANVPIAGEGKKKKVRPTVAIGWGALVLFLALIGAFLALAPSTVVSILPGAAKLYGGSANPTGLDIQGVRYAWEDGGQGPVLKVEGQVVNTSGSEVTVPPVIVALQDKSGAEVTAVTTEIGPLAPGASAPFVAEIPSPEGTVSNLQVRFAEAS